MGERQQGDIAGPLDGLGQLTLVARAGARHAAGDDLAPLADEGADHVVILVIDGHNSFRAEPAGLAPGTAETAATAFAAFAGPALTVSAFGAGFEFFLWLFHCLSP